MNRKWGTSDSGEAATPRSLWRNRDYMILWAGQAVSSTGSQVSRIAFPLLVLALTGSAAQAGFVSAIENIPYVVLSLVAGAMVDRWNRKRTMIVCDCFRTVALGSIPVALWLGSLPLALVYAVALIEGTFNVFFDLAETAALPRVVTPAELPLAMAQNSATWSTSSLVGRSLGGALFGAARAVPFLADAVSYAASVGSLFFIRTPFQEERAVAAGATLGAIRREVVEGLTWLWRHPLICFMAFFSAATWIAMSGNSLLVIVLAKGHHASSATIGLILAAGGAGGVVGSIAGGWAQRRLGFALPVIGAVWIWALLWPLYDVAPNVIAIAAITAGIFFMFPVYNVVQMGYRMLLIPDQLQGRVNSVFRLVAFAGMPPGWALTGILLQYAGARATALVLSAWMLALAVWITTNPHVRHARPLARASFESNRRGAETQRSAE